MPELRAFPGIRFDPNVVDPCGATAPPYDVVDAQQRARLGEEPHNIVHADLPDGDDPYRHAGEVLRGWAADGATRRDPPSLYIYEVRAVTPSGRSVSTRGVLGALVLGDDDILAHEHTTPKARTDRLELRRATRTDLSAIWTLSAAAGLSDALRTNAPPDVDFADADGTEHRLWVVDDPTHIATIAALVARAPVVIADGHHRYETACAHRTECREQGEGEGGHDSLLAWVVELAADQLCVRPIHRLIHLTEGKIAAETLSDWFQPRPVSGDPAELESLAVGEGGPVLVTGEGSWLLEPRHEAFASVRELDTSRLDAALEAVPTTSLTYLHDAHAAVDAVRSGGAEAAVLMRPATVEQILDIAHGGERMPPKTTFFWPKPCTGLVWRNLDD